jgi:hypothetical protein
MTRASWQGPPRDILGGAVLLQRLFAQTERAVVALRHVVAYPDGCSLSLRLAVRRGALEPAVWERLTGRLSGQEPAGRPADDDLKFGVRFPDGTRATSVDNAFSGWGRSTDRPEPPMLVETGADYAGTDSYLESDRELWLWPLPPPEPFEFVVEWRALGIGTTAGTLDGAAIAGAAELARPYWP